MEDVPRSAQFDDIYFSAQDGLAETKHVFIEGNNLPQAWQGQQSFVIAETGFGTGLNFLSAWKLFEETAVGAQTLDFISIEKYPLTPDFIKNALCPWAGHFGGRIDILCDQYPLRVAGFHRVKINSQITLTLIFDDILDAMPQIDAQVDCWFLDGFTPAKNPDMWSEVVFKNMARLSVKGASLATFTAAGDVRRGLQAAGFEVKKTKGFGHKRDMVVGSFTKGIAKTTRKSKKTIAIIGGGLAGTACAYTLTQYGFDPVIYEASNTLAHGASGNSTGFYNPRFTAQRDDISNFFAPAYAQLIKLAQQAGDEIDYDPCGALHLINSPEKEKRFSSLIEKWGWDEAYAQIIDPKTASDIAGIEIHQSAFYMPQAGSVNPSKLCAYYAQGTEVKYNSPVHSLDYIDADAVIICNAAAAKNFEDLNWLPVEKVRGQVSIITPTLVSQVVKCNLHYGGYLSKFSNGAQMCGATFQKWVNDLNIQDEDHARNIETLKDNIQIFKDEDFTVQDGWVGFRAASKDRFPIVGAVPKRENAYLSTAFGSHGILGSLMAAHLLADELREGPKCLPHQSIKSLLPQRFIDRAHKKGQKIT